MPNSDLMRKLVAYAQGLRHPIAESDLYNAVIEHAYGTLGFGGEEEELWTAFQAAFFGAAPERRNGRHRTTRRQPTQAARGSLPNDIKARYCFVTIPDTVVPAEKVIPLDEPLEDGYCAEITVVWAAETPILIGETVKERAENAELDVVKPFALSRAGGTDYVIPGPTLRGMIRAVAEIAGFGRLSQLNAHHRYGLRDFEHPYYKAASDVSKVQAGWLARNSNGDGYTITPCDWGHVEIDALLATGAPLAGQAANARQWSKDRNLQEKYEAIGRYADDETFDFSASSGTYLYSTTDHGRRVFTPRTGGDPGYLVFSDETPAEDGKRFEYVFFDKPNARPAMVTPEAMESFERLHSRPSRNRPEPDGSWQLLKPTVEAGGRIPVFYVGDLAQQDSGDFAFGLTRLFKLPHKHSVGDVLRRQSEHKPSVHIDEKTNRITKIEADFVESLFGYVYEPKDLTPLTEDRRHTAPSAIARKGRIAFSFAHLLPRQQVGVEGRRETIMMAPRASYAPFYLRGTGVKDWSADNNRLAGRKRYLPCYPQDRRIDARNMIGQALREPITNFELGNAHGIPLPNRVKSRLRFLFPSQQGDDIRFESRIRLHNVTAAEIGLVLWTLTHGGAPEKPFRHMVGRAKPFGAGQLRVVSARLAVARNDGTNTGIETPAEEEIVTTQGDGPETGYCPRPVDGETAGQNASHRPFLEAFERYMEEKAPGWRESPTIRELLGACDPRKGAELVGKGSLASWPLRYHHDGEWRYPFQELRKAVKMTEPPSPPAAGTPERILPTPERNPRRRS